MRRPPGRARLQLLHSHYYTATRDRRTGGLATLSVARKLARRCYHTLRELGEEALQPAASAGASRRAPARP